MAGMTGVRITMTIPHKQYELLQILSNANETNPGEMAKGIVLEGLNYLADMVKIADVPNISPDVAIRKMYKKALTDMVQMIDE